MVQRYGELLDLGLSRHYWDRLIMGSMGGMGSHAGKRPGAA